MTTPIIHFGLVKVVESSSDKPRHGQQRLNRHDAVVVHGGAGSDAAVVAVSGADETHYALRVLQDPSRLLNFKSFHSIFIQRHLNQRLEQRVHAQIALLDVESSASRATSFDPLSNLIEEINQCSCGIVLRSRSVPRSDQQVPQHLV